MADERFDGLFMNVAQQAGSIDNIFDSFFGFMLRKTDFFVGVDDKSKAKTLVDKSFNKYWEMAEKKRDEEKARNAAADQERKARQAAQKAKDDAEWAKKQAEKASSSVIEEVNDDAPVGIVKSSEQDVTMKAAAEEAINKAGAEEEEDTGPAPEGNGGKTDKYNWTQTLSTLELFIPLKPGTKSKDLNVVIKANSLKVAYKSDPSNPILDGKMHSVVKIDDSMWTLQDNKLLQISFEKYDQMKWWECVMEGDEKIDTKKIVPENSKLSDLDGETRQTVEKMMYDQQMKQMGKPTSDQQKQHDMLEKFKSAHPEMDFSKCKVNYGGNDGGMGNFNLGGGGMPGMPGM